MSMSTTTTSEPLPLTTDQINTYLRDGILVVDNLLSREELLDAHQGLAQTLMGEYGVDVHDLEGTGHKLVEASSTNGAGGVLDIFYPEWKMRIATNELLFRMTCQLWKEAYCNSGESLEDLAAAAGQPSLGADTDIDIDVCKAVAETCGENEEGLEDMTFKWHPFGAFDCDRGYMYIDRIGYRIPTNLAARIGKQLTITNNKKSDDTTAQSTTTSAQQKQRSSSSSSSLSKNNKKITMPKKKKKQKPRPIQRCLTPHFDCCPENYHDNNATKTKNKWRPIQCFVSLTDNLHPNTGGFEAVPGFHREFSSWVKNGRQSLQSHEQSSPDDDGQSRVPHPQPCVGEYTHLSPSHDRDIMKRVQHVPVKAGSVVFWDNRTPHGNAYRNDPPPDHEVVNVNNDDTTIVHGQNARNDDDSTITDVNNILGQSGARAVVYCSFLPDVSVNRNFVQRQLEDWKVQRAPRVGDRWIRQEEEVMEKNTNNDDDDDGAVIGADDEKAKEDVHCENECQCLSELGKKLVGLVEWT